MRIFKMIYRDKYFKYFVCIGYLSSLFIFLAIAKLLNISLLDNYLFQGLSSYVRVGETPSIIIFFARYLLALIFISQITQIIAIIIVPVTLFNYGQIEYLEVKVMLVSNFAAAIAFAVPVNLVLLMLFN